MDDLIPRPTFIDPAAWVTMGPCGHVLWTEDSQYTITPWHVVYCGDCEQFRFPQQWVAIVDA